MAHESDPDALIQRYAAGAELLKNSLAEVRPEQFDLTPIAGQWSFRQVVCHLADFETINANRMKRVLATDNPVLLGADENAFFAALRYDLRSVAEELELIASQRSQMTRILRSLAVEDFQRTGVHSEDGPMTLERLLERTVQHIPHHVEFIRKKVRAL